VNEFTLSKPTACEKEINTSSNNSTTNEYFINLRGVKPLEYSQNNDNSAYDSLSAAGGQSKLLTSYQIHEKLITD